MGYALIESLRANIARVFIGNPEAIDRLITCLLARGHVLIEDVPGVGKTVLATALARSVSCEFRRIQLTPDMLPGDVLGVSVYDRTRGEFEFKRGPIFSNIVLADEINRTPPRTQAALLESMNESTVSVEGRSIRLEQPFMVIATQNPFEFEGTYPLPENQLDRFLMQIGTGYPNAEDEVRVLLERPGERALRDLGPIMSREDVLELQAQVDRVHTDTSLARYIVELARRLREHEELAVGLSPRGALALEQTARATAVLHDRDYTIPEDILENAHAVCSHRVVARTGVRGASSGVGAEVVREVIETTPSPV